MKPCLVCAVLLSCLVGEVRSAPAADPQSSGPLVFHLQSRVATPQASGQFEVVSKTAEWDPTKTAVIVCDMWARHWCDGACKRGAAMAPRMNEFIAAARRRGALIVHAPSSGVGLYKDLPARRRAQDAPKASNLPAGMANWAGLIPSEKGAVWPIDQADGGCDDQPKCPDRPMDVHQTPAIEIRDEDAISDSGVECWNLFEARGIQNVLLVGVHTNMCVIGRPFGLRNMVRVGKNVALVRDLTDTMYNSRSKPNVSHVCGTDLIVEYIEKYVCPTITSSQLLGGPSLRFAEDKRPNVVLVAYEDEYKAAESLTGLAGLLRDRYGCRTVLLAGENSRGIAGLEELDAADVMVLFARRKALPKEQLDRIRAYLGAGRPLVALRTASHAFSVPGKKTAEGTAQWPEFDADVLGGHYHGHGPNAAGADVGVVAAATAHPILAGVQPARWHSPGSLYYASPIDPKATVLLTGSAEERTEPVAWTRSYKNGRVFYTSLGHAGDFRQPPFRTLLVNALFWAMGRPAPK
jgi:type 1 glutamine amidotransferase/nicotinamidase-related amidase